MDKKLLKKLGNYFTKGVKVGALTTAILMGAGCDSLTQDQDTHQEQEIDYDEDLYSYIFLRHRFVERDAEIRESDSNKTKLAWSNRHFEDATTYMRQKIADLQYQIREVEPEGNFLQPICDEIFVDAKGNPDDGFNHTSLDPILKASNARYSNLLGAIAAKGADGFGVFRSCYSLLALQAYNDSLGKLSYSTTFPLNTETTAIANDANRFGVKYDFDQAEVLLNEIVENAAQKTGVSAQTLRDAINLALLDNSLCGLHDLAKAAGFQVTSEKTLQPSNLVYLNYNDIIHNPHVDWSHYKAIYKEQEAAAQQNQDQEQGL